jgi:hypothetical protein
MLRNARKKEPSNKRKDYKKCGYLERALEHGLLPFFCEYRPLIISSFLLTTRLD